MKKALVILLVVGTAVAAWRWRSGRSTEIDTNESRLVFDRVWIDHLPRNDKDTIQIFAAITDEPLGVFQATSAWKGAFEFFRYEANGDEIRMLFPQTNDRDKVKAKARSCNDKDMDYCLELNGSSRGVKKYYSRKGWEIDGNHAQERIEAIVRSLPTTD